jgi:hypothetical protein
MLGDRAPPAPHTAGHERGNSRLNGPSLHPSMRMQPGSPKLAVELARQDVAA